MSTTPYTHPSMPTPRFPEHVYASPSRLLSFAMDATHRPGPSAYATHIDAYDPETGMLTVTWEGDEETAAKIQSGIVGGISIATSGEAPLDPAVFEMVTGTTLAEALADQEGIDLVEAIHRRKEQE